MFCLYAEAMGRGPLQALWDEPRAVAPPGTAWWDRALVAGLVPLTALEAGLRTDVVWPVWHAAWALVCVAALWWRARHPLTMLVVAYGAQTVAGVVPALAGEPHSVLDVTAVVLLLAYSLGRWASGRGVVAGCVFLLVAHLGREPLYDSSGASMLLGVGALMLPVALGALARFWAASQVRGREEVRVRERERLARDLHDTVAHHVSGILMQARAAKVRGRTDPTAAVEAMDGVEEAATQTLEDMRSMVAVLRERDGEDDGAGRTPTYGVRDIPLLAQHHGRGPAGGRPDLRRRRTAAGADRVGALPRRAGGGDQRPASRRGPDRGGDRPRPRQGPGAAAGARRRPAGRARRWTTSQPFLRSGRHARADLPRGRGRAGRAGPCRWMDCRSHGSDHPRREEVNQMTAPVRLLIADDQDMVRVGLATILDAEPSIEVVGQARDGREAVDLVRTLRPDVCVFDIRMPVLDGIEATRQVAGPEVDDPVPVIVITTFDQDEYVYDALRAGARGFLLKDADPDLLARAVRSAAAGDALIAPAVTARLLATFASSRVGSVAEPVDPLTPREEAVLDLAAAGRTNSEIAEDLHLSMSTVKTHIGALMTKLSARNRVELVIWAYESGRVDHRRRP